MKLENLFVGLILALITWAIIFMIYSWAASSLARALALMP